MQPPSLQRHVSSARRRLAEGDAGNIWRSLGGRQHAASTPFPAVARDERGGGCSAGGGGEACVDVPVRAADVGRVLQLRCDNGARMRR